MTEQRLSETTGMSRAEIARRRPPGAEKKGREMEWPAEEEARLVAECGGGAVKKAAPAVEELTVVRWDFPNRQVIEARRKSGEKVLVRVLSSANFRPKDYLSRPMTLPARQDKGKWYLVGRCPRWPGKW